MCRKFITLKQEQEEDAQQLRGEMAEKALEGKPFPRKQPDDYHMVGRAAPIRHI